MGDLLFSVAVSGGSNENEEQPETVEEARLMFLKERKHCDVTSTFPNQPDRIEAHELFLRVRSPVFEEMYQKRKVRGKEIEITEATPQRFQEFLEFIYADKFETNVAGALELLHLAHKYKIGLLTKKCEQLLKTDINAKNCVRIFEAAKRYGLEELKDEAGDTLVNHLAFLMGDSSLANAEEHTIIYLLGRDDLNVKEVKLFEFVLQWGKHQIAPSTDEQLLKDKLKKVITMIPYTKMTPDEFTMVVHSKELLPADEMLSLYHYFYGNETTRKNATIEFNTAPRREDKMGGL